MSAYASGWKQAARDASKASGHYDGRFAPKVVIDKYHESRKSACRQTVEVPEEEEDAEEVIMRKTTPTATWNEEVSFNPFAAFLR